MRSYTFEYDSRWPDLLTAYDGHSIIYDEIGNPTSYYNGTSFTMSWAQGRRLETIQTGNKTISFAYDMDGIRRSKTVVTDTDAKRTTSQTDFITQSGLIVQQTTVTTVLTKSTDATTTTTRVLEFTYDAQQRPFCVLDTYTKTDGTQSQTRYYYVLNLQGDVVALMTASGSIWATYTYDAWGKPLQVLNGSNTALSSISDYFANVNPLRYRGYYYDTETGFYYLQSRYYDPGIGRFVNADGQYDTDLNGGLNMFAYCGNNPVNNSDPTGHSWASFWGNVGNFIKSVGTSIANCVKSVFGAGSTIVHQTNQETEVCPPVINLAVTVKAGTKESKTISSIGNSSKPISVYAQGRSDNPPLSSVGLKVNIASFTIDVSLGLDNIGVSGSIRQGDMTNTIGVKVNLSQLKIGFEKATTVNWDETTSFTTYANASVTGWFCVALLELYQTGQWTQPAQLVY